MLAQTLSEAVINGTGIERPCLCPVHGDTNPSASVNVLLNVWVCYTCGARGRVEGEALLGERNFGLLRRYVNKTLAEDKIYPESWLNQFDAGPIHPYWLSRFSEEACRHFRLGYDLESDRVTYPLRDSDGSVLGVVSRALGEPVSGQPKYKYPLGVDVGQLLFQGHTAVTVDTLVLVEGAADAIALWEAGIFAVAIYGSQLREPQVRLIEQMSPSRIICMFDRDEAGWNAYITARQMITRYPVERATWPKTWGKDVGELTKDQRRDAYERVVHSREQGVGSSTCESSQRRATPPSRSPLFTQQNSHLLMPRL